MTAAVTEPELALDVEHVVAAAEEANESGSFSRALELLADVRVGGVEPPVALRALLAEAWARMHAGELLAAESSLERARAVAETLGDVERAQVLFQLGCARLKQGAVANAASLLTVALELADRSGAACDRLRALVLERRARCWQRQRDWEAARADVERAVELAERLHEPRTLAHVLFMASFIAERERQWLLAQFYGERALSLYRESGDAVSAAKVLNNLGGLAFLLGDADAAREHLTDAFRAAADLGDDVGAAYALSSLAQVHLRAGESPVAEQRARRALELLAGRVDHLAEIGNAQLVRGRALLALGRLDEAESLFLQAEVSLTGVSPSHQATAWMAQGELEVARGRCEAAVAHYRRAAEALQDVHF